MEEKQSDSKRFWGKFKLLRNSIHVAKSPPPVATDQEGKVVTDPVEVLRTWRDFSATIASADLTGTQGGDIRRRVQEGGGGEAGVDAQRTPTPTYT